MTFDATISLGSILQIVALVITGLAAFFSLRGHVRLLEEKISGEREQRSVLQARVDRLETQIETDIEKLRVSLDEGLRRIYDRLERKADK